MVHTKNNEGAIGRTVGFKKIEQEKLYRERKYYKLIEDANSIIIRWNARGIVTFINQYGLKRLQYTSKEIVGQSMIKLVPVWESSSGRDLYQLLKEIIEDPARYEFSENENVTRDGQRFWVSWTNKIEFDKNGNLIGAISIGNDISELKNAEAELAQEKLFSNTVIASIPGPFFVVDRDGRFVHWNQYQAEIIGKRPEEIPHEKVLSIIYEEDRAYIAGKLTEAFEKGSAEFEARIVWGNGTVRNYYLLARRMEIKNKAYIVVGSGRDVTDLRSAEKNLRESCVKLRQLLEGIISAISIIVETRDPYTAGHQKHVAILASTIAEELGLSEDRVQGIGIAAALHDIGKIYVPTEILNKPGTLSQLELDIIKMHPRAGYDILKRIEFPWPVAQIALQHQERYNGSGYPSGLSGESILLEARILAVADVVEAMTSHRPYQAAKGVNAALEEIQKNSGILFDPHVVDACIKLIKDKRIEFDEIPGESPIDKTKPKKASVN